MIRTLYLIPARGGSKGVPGKNIKLLGGKPLIAYSIELARQFSPDEFICVSTDSDEIIEVVENLGLQVPFKRPDHLATDTSSSYDVIMHALETFQGKGVGFDNVVLLQPTSPFRTKEHVEGAIHAYNDTIDMVVSVNKVKSNVYSTYYKEAKDDLIFKLFENNKSDVRRQGSPPVFELNGAVYVMNVQSLKTKPMHDFSLIKKIEMDDLSSIDIDDQLDWDWCEFLLTRNKTILGNSNS